MTTYDPNEAQALATEMQRRAASAPIYFTLNGAVLGAVACGYFVPTRLVVLSILGGFWGGLVGYRIGRAYALRLRTRAQSLLCQMKIEENTRGGRRGET